MAITVTYAYHSGFSVETGAQLLVFDRITKPAEAPTDKPRTFFVSHGHFDHYSQGIFDPPLNGARFVLSSDIRCLRADVHTISPLETLDLGDLRVYALPSTDLGVAFHVRFEQAGRTWTIFHAGDLNWWHWRDESTPAEVRQSESDFLGALSCMPEGPIDIAFFPVDPRLGTDYDAGARVFADRFRPRYFFPMHFQDKAEAARDFQASYAREGVRVVALTQRGERFDIPE